MDVTCVVDRRVGRHGVVSERRFRRVSGGVWAVLWAWRSFPDVKACRARGALEVKHVRRGGVLSR